MNSVENSHANVRATSYYSSMLSIECHLEEKCSQNDTFQMEMDYMLSYAVAGIPDYLLAHAEIKLYRVTSSGYEFQFMQDELKWYSPWGYDKKNNIQISSGLIEDTFKYEMRVGEIIKLELSARTDVTVIGKGRHDRSWIGARGKGYERQEVKLQHGESYAIADPLFKFSLGQDTTGLSFTSQNLTNPIIAGRVQNINTVPEPSTLAIFTLGLMGLLSRRFRNQATKSKKSF